MNKFFSKIAIGIASFAMVVGVGVAVATTQQANPVYAETATMTAGTNGSACTVNGKDGIKVGTSSKGGDMTITVGAGATGLTLYSAAWKGVSGLSLKITGATVSPSSISLKADAGISNNSPFTLNGDESNYKFELELSNITSETNIKFESSTNKRFVVWSASYQTGSGTGNDDPIALANPNPQYDDETKLVSWTTDSNASKYQIKVDSNSYEDIETTTYDASNLTVGEEHTVSIKAVGDETKYTSSEGSVKFTPTMYEIHRKFTVTGKNSVSESGDVITGATAKLSETYYNADKQLTGGNNATLSITGLTNKVSISKLVISMHSNASKGAGSISVTIDGGTPIFIAGTSSSVGADFKTFGDNTVFTSAFKDVTWKNLNYVAKSSIEIKIYCTVNSLYCESFSIYFTESENADVVTALSVSPDSWEGYTTSTLDVSKFEVSVTTNGETGSTGDYEFLGIGYMNDDEFVARDAKFTVGNPKIEDTRLCWKAKSPTEANGSTYLYAYVTLTVSADAPASISIENDMFKTDYYTDDEWEWYGLNVKLNYTSGATEYVTGNATINYYSDSAMTNEIATPKDLGVCKAQMIYIKATYGEISNTIGYVQVVSVSIEHGTLINDPLTADQAIEIGATFGNNGETQKQYYIRGIVASIKTNQLDQEGENKYATFDLEENNEAFSFTCFQMTTANGVENYKDLRIGAEVLIQCRIKNYKNIVIENGSQGQILSISYKAEELTGISLNKTNMLLGLNSQETLTVSPVPLAADLDKINWSTSNDAIATVDQNGNVTGVSQGVATITATCGEFKAKCKVDVCLSAMMQYSGTTSNMKDTDNNAESVNLDAKLFTVNASKASSNDIPGLNKDGDIRLYRDATGNGDGSEFTVMIDASYTITKVSIKYVAFAKYAAVYSGSNTKPVVADNNNFYAIYDSSFKVKDIGTETVKIASIEIFYRSATAEETISALNTQTSLAYNYDVDGEGNFTYSNIVMRFGAKISKDLWNELDTNEHAITGFGVMIADGEMIKSDADFAEAIENNFVTPSTENTNVEEKIAIDYFVPVANMETTIGVEGDNYFWNLRFSVDTANIDKMYSAIAYVKVGDEYVVLNMARESVVTLAKDYIANRGCDATTAGGSLSNLAK